MPIAPTKPPGAPPTGGGGGSTRPPATTTYQPPPIAQGRKGLSLFVRRHDGSPLPNIRCLSRSRHEFHAWTGQFRYAFDQSSFAGTADPRRVEQCLAMVAKGSRTLAIDDRIRVVRMVGTRRTDILFDGFLVAPQAELADKTEAVTFTVASVPIREWDTPLGGAVYRDNEGIDSAPNDDSNPALPQDIQTDLPARFNPNGKPNAIKKDNYSGEGNYKYPVFVDENLPTYRQTDTETIVFPIEHWTLAGAVKYCLAIGNPRVPDDADPEADPVPAYVDYSAFTYLDDLFTAVRSTSEDGWIDMSDPDTFTREPIIVADCDVTGMCWPDAVRRLIEPHGFGFRFDLKTDEDGEPKWKVVFYRKDDGTARKNAFLQRAGEDLIPGKSIVSALSLVRDCSGIQNQWRTLSKPVNREASVILGCTTFIEAADLVTSTGDPSADKSGRYIRNRPPSISTTPFDPQFGRIFILGEGARADDGFYMAASGLLRESPTSLDALFKESTAGVGGFKAPPSEGTEPRTYVHRRRPPIAPLITKDIGGEPRAAILEVSINYGGTTGVWDPSALNLDEVAPDGPESLGGTWQQVPSGWTLLEDRIGIELTMANPRSWAIGSQGGNFLQSGVLDVLNCLCNGTLASVGNPRPEVPRIFFRLTTVIEADHDIDATAKRRGASPTGFTITRFEDSRDRFKKHIITKRSSLAKEAGITVDTADVDDTDDAKSQSEARRRSNECGTFAGTVTVPYFTDSLNVGDKLKGVVGRDISFEMNAGREQGEAALYPIVIGIADHFEGGQSTSVTLQDYRSEPPPEHRRRVRS